MCKAHIPCLCNRDGIEERRQHLQSSFAALYNRRVLSQRIRKSHPEAGCLSAPVPLPIQRVHEPTSNGLASVATDYETVPRFDGHKDDPIRGPRNKEGFSLTGVDYHYITSTATTCWECSQASSFVLHSSTLRGGGASLPGASCVRS